jgi:hypothetical protein
VLAIDAAGQLFGGPYAGHAIYRLDPDGWHHLFDTPGTISSLVTDANVPGTFWINSLDAIHVTRDGGATFQIVSRPSPFAYALFGDPRRSNVLYTIADALYQSTDGAVTWKRLGSTRGLPFVGATERFFVRLCLELQRPRARRNRRKRCRHPDHAHGRIDRPRGRPARREDALRGDGSRRRAQHRRRPDVGSIRRPEFERVRPRHRPRGPRPPRRHGRPRRLGSSRS